MKRSPMPARRTPLRPGGPIQERARLERGGRLKRTTPMKKANPERRAKLRDAQFGPQAALCRLLPCVRCWQGPSDPHHTKSRGAGGLDDATAPLCRRCHEEVHQYGPGIVTLDLVAVARLLAAVVAVVPAAAGGEETPNG